MSLRPILAALAVCLCECATLTPISPGTCGNGVLDPGEDCDGIDPTCGKPESGPTACRLTCDRIAGPACALGSSCGVDKICRRATGKIATAGAPISANVVALLSGDFDGDGQTDIVAAPPFGSAGSSRVHYFDRDARLASTTALDLPLALPIVHDFDGDKKDDLGFAVAGMELGAFAALGGRADRTFATIVYPAISYPMLQATVAIVDPPRSTTGRSADSCAVMLLSEPSGGGTLQTVCGRPDMKVSFAPADLVGDPGSGSTSFSRSPCGEAIFATPSTVFVDGLCNEKYTGPADYWRTGDLIRITAPGILTGLYIGPVESLIEDTVLALTADGIWILRDAPGGPRFERAPPPLDVGQSLPLASGDLDGDGKVDFVFPGGIFLTMRPGFGGGPPGPPGGGNPSGFAVVPRNNLRWSAAKIARFNDDELPDVLVSFPSALDADVLGNAGGGLFTTFSVHADQTVRAIAAGDFDGDRIADVALLESNNELGAGSEADLAIAFGRATGGPDLARFAGRFKDARGIAAFHNNDTAIDNLGVLETGTAASSVTVLFGSGGRQQVAPLFLSDVLADPPAGEGKTRFWRPLSFSVGSFTRPKSPEILAIASGLTFDRDRPSTERLVPGFSTGAWIADADPARPSSFLPFRQEASLDDFVGIDEANLRDGKLELGVLTTAGDIDVPADGIDEVVTLTRSKDGGGATLYLVRPSGNRAQGAPVVAATLPGALVTGGERIELADIDGDGALDLMVLVRVASKRGLYVFRGKGAAGFDPPVALALPVPDEPVAFTLLATEKKQRELAVATRTKVFVASLTAAREISLGIPDPRLTAIVAGDVDGDGVADLVVADDGAIRVLRQEPAVR